MSHTLRHHCAHRPRTGSDELIYLVASVVSGALFTAYAVALQRDPTPARAMKLFHFSITYLTVLFVAMPPQQRFFMRRPQQLL